jgi:hypothetical protein
MDFRDIFCDMVDALYQRNQSNRWYKWAGKWSFSDLISDNIFADKVCSDESLYYVYKSRYACASIKSFVNFVLCIADFYDNRV